MNSRIILFTGLVLSLASCKKEVVSPDPSIGNGSKLSLSQSNPAKGTTFKGPEVSVGNGKARSVYVVDEAGKPVSLSIELTNAALTGLPEGDGFEFVLPLHPKVNDLTPFQHIVMDWNPHGHEPAHVYDVPHFDFHFYKITLAQRMAISPYSPATASLFDNFPPPGFLPPTYIPIPGGVPEMGKHWVDVTSPEFHGVPFTKTFIYGTYDGAVTFMEPMVTMATLQTGVNSQAPISTPQYFAPTSKYYPTVYKVEADDANHYIRLTDYVLR